MIVEDVLKNDKAHFVVVTNNIDIYNKVIRDNTNINHYPVNICDNTSQNSPITQRYNTYINENIKPDSDFWVIFCHHDFGFLEDPLLKLKELDKNFIYGAVGAKLKRGLFFRNSRFVTHKRFFIGNIKQGNGDSTFRNLGEKVKRPQTVNTLDCCCIILHSSLITGYNLRFDENLKFHMYAEDFCLNAKSKHGIESKVVQFDCYHLGQGNPDDEFFKSVEYVKNKYGLKRVVSTCLD